jgi:hypothetical protein
MKFSTFATTVSLTLALLTLPTLAKAQTFGSWSGSNWSGGGFTATTAGGAAGVLSGNNSLAYSGALASFSPVPVSSVGTLAGVTGTALDLSLAPGLAATMSLLIDNLAITMSGGGIQYRMQAFDSSNNLVSLAGVTRALTDVNLALYVDELTLNNTTGDFGIVDLPGGDNLNTSTSLFTGFNPIIRRLVISTSRPSPGGDTWHVGIQISPVAAPEPSSLMLLALGVLGGLGVIRRRR